MGDANSWGPAANDLARQRVGRHYPVVCPDQPACAQAGVRLGELPVARRLAARELSIHPYLTDDEVEHVIAACLEQSAGTAKGRKAPWPASQILG